MVPCTAAYSNDHRVIGWIRVTVTCTTTYSTDHRIIGWIWVMVTCTATYSTDHMIIGSIPSQLYIAITIFMPVYN
jgi:hypothetical protein